MPQNMIATIPERARPSVRAWMNRTLDSLQEEAPDQSYVCRMRTQLQVRDGASWKLKMTNVQRVCRSLNFEDMKWLDDHVPQGLKDRIDAGDDMFRVPVSSKMAICVTARSTRLTRVSFA